MNPKFQATVHPKEDVAYAKIAGVIDEDNELGSLEEKLTAPTAIINLSEIERINSCGVRDWVNWLGRLEKNGAKKIVLVECSPSIVAQINLVNNFTGSGVVKSFYAPYFCPNCDREKVLLVETRDIAGQDPVKAPTCRCDECDGVMDFDDMEDSFFAFLANEKKIVTDASVEAALTEFTPSSPSGEQRLRLRTSISNPGVAAAGGTATGATPSGQNGSAPATVTRTTTNPGGSGSGQKWPAFEPSEVSRRFVMQPAEPRSAGAWILVGVLVVVAVALLAYVFLSGPK